MGRNALKNEYDELYHLRNVAIREVESRIETAMDSLSSHPRVKGRIKTFDSYYKKVIRLIDTGIPITDLFGIRVICHFLEDLARAEEILKEHFQVVEVERKGGDHTFREFGYESIHLLIRIPEDIARKNKISPEETIEIQIRTILQDAWAEVEHELIYKAEFSPFDGPLKRKLAAVNASISLADIIFQEIRSYQRALNDELKKRQDSFFRKIEDSTDAFLFTGEESFSTDDGILSIPHEEPLASPESGSIDELLLGALYAHNQQQFDEAIAGYTRILEMKPDDTISALIYKHRGMAHFARSHYEAAISDFQASYKLDNQSYKVAYYEGVVCSVLQQYSQAVEAFNRSLEINPFQPYSLYRRGQAFYHLLDYPRALADCEAALAIESFEAARKFKDLVLTKLRM
ncbi:MAG: tetratricopeptide repeat protein [Treponema sp.]|nr:tetratricopeptide repeat protein [Treponema sp.]